MSKYSVSVEFTDMNVAIRATELLSVAFPMLKFQFCEIPEICFGALEISEELKNDIEMGHPISSFSLEHNKSKEICKSCKKVHKYADMTLNCEGCPNA